MAICDLCNNEMTTGASCVVDTLHLEGRAYPLEPHRGRRDASSRPCGDCGVAQGGLHHLGCDLQRCPLCRSQLFSCGCPFDELTDLYVDDDDCDNFDDCDDFDDCDGCDDCDDCDPEGPPPLGRASGAVVVPLRDTRIVSLDAAAAPARARHAWALLALRDTTLPSGAALDPGLACVLLDLLLSQHRAARSPVDATTRVRLRRPDVDTVCNVAFRNWCAFERVLIPDRVPEHLWALLEWMRATGRLLAGSDPLHALLEPLQCTGGLDAKGIPLPPGAPRTVQCQCKVPFDPQVPAGQIARVISFGLDAGPFVEHVHPPALDGSDVLEHLLPLGYLALRLRKRSPASLIDPQDWAFSGRCDARGDEPALWFYGHLPSSRRGFDALALDVNGVVYRPRPDRRRTKGFRWQRAPDAAAFASGPWEAFWGTGPSRAPRTSRDRLRDLPHAELHGLPPRSGHGGQG